MLDKYMPTGEPTYFEGDIWVLKMVNTFFMGFDSGMKEKKLVSKA
jgi:hypothetical protein